MTNIYLVFDIGKTNKKALYYTNELGLLEKRARQINVIKNDGLETEDIDTIKNWLLSEIKIASQRHTIDGIAISCHGGTFALLDKDDQLTQPVLSYTSEVTPNNQTSFYETYGSIQELQNTTSSPDLGFVNIAKQIHYVATTSPAIWDKTASFLFYPQYLGFLLTNNKAMEVTILGNHSYMWDFNKKAYSQFTQDSGLINKITGDIKKPFKKLGDLNTAIKAEFSIDYDIPVTVGIHDSNASILPYLLKESDEFTLLSTGTWCVGMKPNQPYHLSPEDLQTKTFYNLDAFGKPLRTSISPIGFEYEEYSNAFKAEDPNQIIDIDQLISNEIVIIPGIIESTSVFADSQPGLHYQNYWIPFSDIKADPSLIKDLDPQAFYMALNASLAIQTAELLNRLNCQDNESIYFEGGFAKNKTYLSCLKALKPQLTFKRTNLEEATAYGAALTIAMATNKNSEQEIKDMIQIESEEFIFDNSNAIELYTKQFFNILGEQHASTTRSN